MFQPNDKINPEPPDNNDLGIDKEKNLDKIDRKVSPKNVADRKKQIEKVFFKLIAFGLIFGAILSVGAYYLLNKLGLTKKALRNRTGENRTARAIAVFRRNSYSSPNS